MVASYFYGSIHSLPILASSKSEGSFEAYCSEYSTLLLTGMFILICDWLLCSLVGKQATIVPPESIGGVPYVLAICDAGQFKNKVRQSFWFQVRTRLAERVDRVGCNITTRRSVLFTQGSQGWLSQLGLRSSWRRRVISCSWIFFFPSRARLDSSVVKFWQVCKIACTPAVTGSGVCKCLAFALRRWIQIGELAGADHRSYLSSFGKWKWPRFRDA